MTYFDIACILFLFAFAVGSLIEQQKHNRALIQEWLGD